MKEVTNTELLGYVEQLCKEYNRLSENKALCYVIGSDDRMRDEVALRARLYTMAETIRELFRIMEIEPPMKEYLKGKKSLKDGEYEYEYRAYPLPVIVE